MGGLRCGLEAPGGGTKPNQLVKLYAICFTGKAKKADRYDRCLSATHKAEDCSLSSDDDPDVARRLKAIESAVMVLTRTTQTGKQREPRECAAIETEMRVLSQAAATYINVRVARAATRSLNAPPRGLTPHPLVRSVALLNKQRHA